MSITPQHQKEALSKAYIRAVIAQAGFNIGFEEFDYGIDGTIKDVIDRNGRYCDTGFGINFQLKSSSNVVFEQGHLVYDLESKNYNDLVAESYALPNILILFVLPSNNTDRLSVSSEQLVIRKCAWWCSLEGQKPTTNQATKRIAIPEEQIFSPESLCMLMKKVKEGEKL